MKLVGTVIQSMAELFIAALETGMLIFHSPFFPFIRGLHPLCAFSQWRIALLCKEFFYSSVM